MTDFILDNSVLSAFHKIGRLSLLKKILENHSGIVPDGVIREIKYAEIMAQVASTQNELSRTKWMLQMNVKPGKHVELDKGEQAVLELAVELGGWAIIDDLKARKQAGKMQIKYAGTLTLLKRAREKKLIAKTELRKIVEDLKGKDQFRMTDELVKWLID